MADRPRLGPARRRVRDGRAHPLRHLAEPDYDETTSVSIGVSHCGAGCALGDIIGAWVVFAASWKPLGLALPGQYFSIAPMRDLGPREGIIAALKADTLSTPCPADWSVEPLSRRTQVLALSWLGVGPLVSR